MLFGIEVLTSAIGNDKVRVHRSCQWVLKELASYCWDPNAQKNGEDKPLKENDHTLDALRYCAVGIRDLLKFNFKEAETWDFHLISITQNFHQKSINWQNTTFMVLGMVGTLRPYIAFGGNQVKLAQTMRFGAKTTKHRGKPYSRAFGF